MTGKFVGLFSRKVAIAAAGGLLLAGSICTVVFAAPGQSVAPLALFSSMHASSTHGASGHGNTKQNGPKDPKGHTSSAHPEIVAIQGTLTQYDAAHATLTVSGKAEDNDDHAKDSHDTDGKPACTLTSPFTINLDGTTTFDGQAKNASHLANEIGHKVEIQAEELANCTLLAKKVTVAAADASANHHTYFGTVGTVGTSSFTLDRKHGPELTIQVTPSTTFDGQVHQLSDLTSGMHVKVQGTLATANTVQASHVHANGHHHMH